MTTSANTRTARGHVGDQLGERSECRHVGRAPVGLGPVVRVEPTNGTTFPASYDVADGLRSPTVLRMLVTGFAPYARATAAQCSQGAVRECGNWVPVQFDDDGTAEFQYFVTDDVPLVATGSGALPRQRRPVHDCRARRDGRPQCTDPDRVRGSGAPGRADLGDPGEGPVARREASASRGGRVSARRARGRDALRRARGHGVALRRTGSDRAVRDSSRRDREHRTVAHTRPGWSRSRSMLPR